MAQSATDVDAAAAVAIATEKLRLEGVAAVAEVAKTEAAAAAATKAATAERARVAEAAAAEQAAKAEATAALLAPHAGRLDTLVKAGKITPAERKDVEQGITAGDTAGRLLTMLEARTKGAGGLTGAQTGVQVDPNAASGGAMERVLAKKRKEAGLTD